MKTTFLSLSFAALLLGLGIFSCTTEPILIEVPGGPITTDTTEMVEIISIIEEDLCDNEVISFQYQVLPILVAGCAYSGCHDTQSHEDGIILESYNQIKREVEAGDPNDSEIYKSMTENPNDDDFMPPSPAIPMTGEQIDIIRQWILQGANNTDCKVACNSEETSFSANIFPLIQDQCLGCHQPTNALGDINLSDYAHVRTFAANGLLMGSIKHDAGYDAMPPTGNKMTDCQIAQIQNWISEGAQDN